ALLAVGGDIDREAFFFQALLDGPEHGFMVFNEQHPHVPLPLWLSRRKGGWGHGCEWGGVNGPAPCYPNVWRSEKPESSGGDGVPDRSRPTHSRVFPPRFSRPNGRSLPLLPAIQRLAPPLLKGHER